MVVNVCIAGFIFFQLFLKILLITGFAYTHEEPLGYKTHCHMAQPMRAFGAELGLLYRSHEQRKGGTERFL